MQDSLSVNATVFLATEGHRMSQAPLLQTPNSNANPSGLLAKAASGVELTGWPGRGTRTESRTVSGDGALKTAQDALQSLDLSQHSGVALARFFC